jgi:hypothetical protein
MQSLTPLLAALPNWLLPLGWAALLVGWVLGRPAVTQMLNMLNKVTVIGANNTTTNIVNQSVKPAASAGGDSTLSKLSSWATVAGLVLTLLPMLKDWLK